MIFKKVMEPQTKPGKTVFKHYDPLDPETQAQLNQPLVTKQGIDPKDEAFLNLVVTLVDAGKINLYSPASLMNQTVYEKLTEDQKGKADFDAFNLLAVIRTIYNLWQAVKQPTYQIQNLVSQVRMTKERLEAISGDIYVI